MDEPRDALFRSLRPVEYRGINRDKLLNIAKERAPDPDELEDAFFWRVVASNGELDSYFTRMDETTLANFVEDAKRGVQFQNSHNGASRLGGGEVGFGRSIDGELKGRAGAKQAEIDFVTIPGLTCGNMTSDAFVRGVKAGIYQDVSVGFTPGRFECSICGGDPSDWFGDCTHYPGGVYDVKRGNKTVQEQAFAWIRDGRLNEVSTVYDGATPGAGILAVEKARHDAENGRLTPAGQHLIEARYRVAVPMRPRPHIMGDIRMTKPKDEQDETTTTPPAGSPDAEATENPGTGSDAAGATVSGDDATDDTVIENPGTGSDNAGSTEDTADVRYARLRAKHEGGPIKLGADPVRAVEALAAALQDAWAERTAVEPLVVAGRAYRDALVARIHAEGVRAFGNGYDRPYWERMTGKMDIADLEATERQFKAKGDEAIPTGRVTKDGADGDGAAVATTTRAEREPTPPQYVGLRTN